MRLACCVVLVATVGSGCFGGGASCPEGESRVRTGQTLVLIPQYNAATKTTTLIQVWQPQHECRLRQ